MELHLFSDIEQFRAGLDDSWSAGIAVCSTSGVEVAVPLEEALSAFNSDDHTGTPIHEMVHALMCRSLGAAGFRHVPRWFQEGMAQLYENDGRHRITKRAWVRILAWSNRDRMPNATEFCGTPRLETPGQVKLFYMIAYEFVRSLERRHGRDALSAVVGDVRSGAGGMRVFEDSLRDRFGGTCTDLYGG